MVMIYDRLLVTVKYRVSLAGCVSLESLLSFGSSC